MYIWKKMKMSKWLFSLIFQADIVFLCDMNQDDNGNIEFVGEADHAYTFKWYTKYACPQPPVECVIRDEATHKQYDLSR